MTSGRRSGMPSNNRSPLFSLSLTHSLDTRGVHFNLAEIPKEQTRVRVQRETRADFQLSSLGGHDRSIDLRRSFSFEEKSIGYYEDIRKL